MANIISIFSFNLVYPAAAGDPVYPVLLLSCLPRKIYAQRELLIHEAQIFAFSSLTSRSSRLLSKCLNTLTLRPAKRLCCLCIPRIPTSANSKSAV